MGLKRPSLHMRKALSLRRISKNKTVSVESGNRASLLEHSAIEDASNTSSYSSLGSKQPIDVVAAAHDDDDDDVVEENDTSSKAKASWRKLRTSLKVGMKLNAINSISKSTILEDDDKRDDSFSSALSDDEAQERSNQTNDKKKAKNDYEQDLEEFQTEVSEELITNKGSEDMECRRQSLLKRQSELVAHVLPGGSSVQWTEKPIDSSVQEDEEGEHKKKKKEKKKKKKSKKSKSRSSEVKKELNNEIELLRQQLEQEQKETTKLKAEAAVRDDRVNELQTQFDLQKGMCKDAQEDYDAVLTKYNEQIAQNQGLLSVVAERKQQNSELQSLLTQKTDRIVLLEAEASKTNETDAAAVAELKEENEALRKREQKLSFHIDELEDQVTLQKEMYEDLHEDYDMLMAKYNEQIDENKSLMENVVELKQVSCEQKSALDETTDLMQVLEQKVVELEQYVDSEKLMQLMEENQSLREMVKIQKQSLYDFYTGNNPTGAVTL